MVHLFNMSWNGRLMYRSQSVIRVFSGRIFVVSTKVVDDVQDLPSFDLSRRKYCRILALLFLLDGSSSIGRYLIFGYFITAKSVFS